MSDLFNGADNAANDQTAGIQKGQAAATGNINQGSSILNSDYLKGLAPFLSNFTNAQQGTTQLSNVLGLNGAAGSNQALQTLQNTPGYQFTLGQGNNAINAQAAATGTTGSGNQALALQKYGSGLASQTYNNYVSQLQPYLGASNASAAGIGGLYSGLGNQLNANQGNLANLNYGADTSIGNAQASAALANQSLDMNLLGGGLNLAMSMFSDERLKENIEKVGSLTDGQPVYSYNYKWDHTPRIGLMAQDVEKRYPEAVTEIGGYKAVNYGIATEMSSALSKFLEAA